MESHGILTGPKCTNPVTGVTCGFEVFKVSVRNQLTHYELEEFFRSLQDLLVLSLNPSLSFDFVEFLSRPERFRKNSERFVFKTTRFVLVRSTTTF